MSAAAAGMVVMDVEGMTKVAGALEGLAGKLGIPIKWLAIDQMRLLLADVIRHLPPKTKKQGESAVGWDISRVIQPMTQMEMANVREFGKDSPILPGGIIFTSKSGAVYLKAQKLYEPYASDARMDEHHRRQRGKNGRVSTAGLYTHNIGRWKVVDTLHVHASVYAEYVRLVKSRVGKLKAAFVPAFDAARAVVGGGDSVPPWVRRQATKNGAWNFSSMSDRGDGQITATNRQPYAAAKAASFLPKLLLKRGKDVDRAFRAEKRAQQILDQFNRGAAA